MLWIFFSVLMKATGTLGMSSTTHSTTQRYIQEPTTVKPQIPFIITFTTACSWSLLGSQSISFLWRIWELFFHFVCISHFAGHTSSPSVPTDPYIFFTLQLTPTHPLCWLIPTHLTLQLTSTHPLCWLIPTHLTLQLTSTHSLCQLIPTHLTVQLTPTHPLCWMIPTHFSPCSSH